MPPHRQFTVRAWAWLQSPASALAATASALVPTEYSGFVWAVAFGWLFFREGVSLPTLAGTALIVAGCWVATRSPAQAQAEPA